MPLYVQLSGAMRAVWQKDNCPIPGTTGQGAFGARRRRNGFAVRLELLGSLDELEASQREEVEDRRDDDYERRVVDADSEKIETENDRRRCRRSHGYGASGDARLRPQP